MKFPLPSAATTTRIVFALAGEAAVRHQLSQGLVYQSLGIAAIAWLASSMWAARRRRAPPNRAGRLRRVLASLGDQTEKVVNTADKKLFLWTPFLSAVFWSAFGFRLEAAYRLGANPFRDQQVFMYFVLAVASTNILLKGLVELRRSA